MTLELGRGRQLSGKPCRQVLLGVLLGGDGSCPECPGGVSRGPSSAWGSSWLSRPRGLFRGGPSCLRAGVLRSLTVAVLSGVSVEKASVSCPQALPSIGQETQAGMPGRRVGSEPVRGGV